MKKIAIIFSIIAFSAYKTVDHNIIGHWSATSQDNSKVLVDFNTDSTFKVTVNGETENEGKFSLNQDTFTMYDEHCGMQMPGRYKLTFYTEDSVSFATISDSCANRVEEVNGAVIKRSK